MAWGKRAGALFLILFSSAVVGGCKGYHTSGRWQLLAPQAGEVFGYKSTYGQTMQGEVFFTPCTGAPSDYEAEQEGWALERRGYSEEIAKRTVQRRVDQEERADKLCQGAWDLGVGLESRGTFFNRFSHFRCKKVGKSTVCSENRMDRLFGRIRWEVHIRDKSLEKVQVIQVAPARPVGSDYEYEKGLQRLEAFKGPAPIIVFRPDP